MRIHLIFAGKTGFGDIDSAIARYLDRLRHYAAIEVHTVKAEKITAGISEDLVREREGERMAKAAGGAGYLAVWDRGGRELGSEELAAFIGKLRDSGTAEVRMAVGGPVGVSPALLRKADAVLSLSRMTFPHDLARLVVVEQLYRAFTILKGEPYHK